MMTTRLRTLPAGAVIPKGPPANLDAEQAFLGALLANNEVYWRVSEALRPEHFFDALHGRVYEACVKLITAGVIANPVTLKRLFDQDGALADVGGAQYLIDLALSVVTVINAEDYAASITDLYLKRNIIDIGEAMVAEARLEELDRSPSDIIDSAEAALAQVAESAGDGGTLEPIRDVVRSALAEVEAAFKLGFGGLNTGFAVWNKKTGGLFKPDLVIVAARPGMGKTTLLVNVIENVARAMQAAMFAEQVSGDRAGAVLLFSHEMSNEQIVKKIIAAHCGVSVHRMRTGSINAMEFEIIAGAADQIAALPIFLEDATNLSPAQALSRARRIKRRYGLTLVGVDYLQLMRANNGAFGNNKTQEVTEISKGLKMIAKELDVPVVALSQLSRAVELREDNRPQLSDLRESGAIEQDADVVLFLYREAYYLKQKEPKQRSNELIEKFQDRYRAWAARLEAILNVCEVIVAKQRHGPIGSFRLNFDGARDRFSEIEDGVPA
jgi:replicative DNA helicase